jgi:hypothetical protein
MRFKSKKKAHSIFAPELKSLYFTLPRQIGLFPSMTFYEIRNDSSWIAYNSSVDKRVI